MLNSTIEMYQATLDGVKKESTATITIPKWNRLINETYETWLRDKSRNVDENKKRIDDIQLLKVATDGIQYAAILPVATNKFPIPVGLVQGNVTYPDYLSFLSVMFKINYSGNDCNTGTSDWEKAWIMRSDSRAINQRNPYRKATDERLFYEIRGGYIYLITGTTSTGNSMKLEYIRKPTRIFLDTDLTGAMMADGPNPTYTAHIGSVNCELTEFQRQEIVDKAVETYLERVKDERYKSNLQEQAIKSQSK